MPKGQICIFNLAVGGSRKLYFSNHQFFDEKADFRRTFSIYGLVFQDIHFW